jgi:epoxyqueuosine reductase
VGISSETIRQWAKECGFELAGIAPALPVTEAGYYHEWVERGYAGEMKYLTDRRAQVRDDPRNLLGSARSIICVAKLYNVSEPGSATIREPERGWISRYAWGQDYHEVLCRGLNELVDKIRQHVSEPFEWKICVDTAPLLERAYARLAGLGWIGKNTCLINQEQGSWFFLGELLISLPLEPDRPAPDRCGTCTRCIDACPTAAFVPLDKEHGPSHTLDAGRCIAYLTIEQRGSAPEELRAGIENHIFGCDICQDVCPWNGRSPMADEAAFQPDHFAPPLEDLAVISETDFGIMFAGSPVGRARYSGFLRNVAVAMGNAKSPRYREPLERLARSPISVVSENAAWALRQLELK